MAAVGVLRGMRRRVIVRKTEKERLKFNSNLLQSTAGTRKKG
jgi:hypothetical protein